MRHLITAAFLLGAVLAYLVGYGQSSVVFVGCGLALESLFWYRMFLRSKFKLQRIEHQERGQ